MRCPKCKDRVIRKSQDGSLTIHIHGPLRANEDGEMLGRCFWCKTDIKIPMELSKGFRLEGQQFVIQVGS